MDITEIILDQHNQQRRLFAALQDFPRDDVQGLGALWHQLENFLLLHAEAEEETFYRDLAVIGTGGGDADGNSEQIEDAIEDHNKLRDAIKRVRESSVGSDEWWTAVVDCDVENSRHMGEEERQDLADFRRQASLELRHATAVAFLRHVALHWEDEPKKITNRALKRYLDKVESADEPPSAEAAKALADEQTPTLRSANPEPTDKASDEVAEDEG